MRKPCLGQVVYDAIFPRSHSQDPGSFTSHVTRNLVPEVRIETSTFYGSLDCIEAQYPGLDYSHAPHRMRLSRFYWHRRLFRAFDELRLTPQEISSLCRWEGTKSARERYEKEEGVKVRDTTAECVQVDAIIAPSIEVHFEDGPSTVSKAETTVSTVTPLKDDESPQEETDESSDGEMESCGVSLNNHLLAATAARDRGVDAPLDEDWEQWLKDARERGSYMDVFNAIRMGQPLPRLRRTGLAQTSVSRSGPFVPMPSRLLPSTAAARRSQMTS